MAASLDLSLASRGPSPGDRLAACVVVWLMLAAISYFSAARFERIYRKLDEKGELPAATQFLYVFSHYDQRSYYILSGLVLLQFLVLDEVVQRVLRLNELGAAWAWMWFTFFLFSGLCTDGALLFALFMPAFKISCSYS